jgi:hypothetical protein
MENGEAPQTRTKRRSPAKVAQILDRGNKILELRKSGASLRAISRELTRQAEANGEPTRGYSYGQVKKDLDEILALRIEERRDKTDEVLVLCEERIEEVLINFAPHLRTKVDGLTPENLVRMKIKAGDLILKAAKELAELYGVKKPQRVEMSGPDGKPLNVVTNVIIEPVVSSIAKPPEADDGDPDE